jgi:hypothetical protein
MTLAIDPLGASDRYRHVWRTDMAWACSCRQFVLALADRVRVHRELPVMK